MEGWDALLQARWRAAASLPSHGAGTRTGALRWGAVARARHVPHADWHRTASYPMRAPRHTETFPPNPFRPPSRGHMTRLCEVMCNGRE